MTEKEIRDSLVKISKSIPDFIDTTSETHYEVFKTIQYIIRLFQCCCINDMMDSERIDNLSIEYFTALLKINNLDKILYRTSYDYIFDLYDRLITRLNDNDLYECSYNLYHMVNPGCLTSNK